jgi:hypothetical protein
MLRGALQDNAGMIDKTCGSAAVAVHNIHDGVVLDLRELIEGITLQAETELHLHVSPTLGLLRVSESV